MLPQIYRLKDKKDFQDIFRKGRRFETGPFALFCVANRRDTSRFGVVVGKAFGSAVLRNRAKRVARHLLMDVGERIRPKSDVILLPRRNFLGEKREMIKRKLEEGLKKLGCRLQQG